ncbi:hypothetical protein PCASD_06441 [Puccinia coronata f. sp. avenae]|uniref:Uncharacterized protein n=1 Tax=Puccinia coronata f. sp. avenae TaxID=200324 RepID=A0A2N5UFG9_9BASI|nr:hypothetical protein PCASD_06441 [Puccinia coronata f. sp. avenae]
MKELSECVEELRSQAGWWLAYNCISRNKVQDEEKLRPQSMIVFESHLLDGPRILGFEEKKLLGSMEPAGGIRKGFPVPVPLTLENEVTSNSTIRGHSFENILVELVRVEGSDGRYLMDFLASLWPDEWLDKEESQATLIDEDYTISIFSPFDIQATETLLALSRFLNQNGFVQQREYELIHLQKSIAGHTFSFNIWRFEKGKGLSIKKSLTIRLLIVCWLPPFLVILGLCVLHLWNPDKGLGDILSLVGAGLTALAAWLPGVVLKGWQLGDAVRGNYYTTNLDIAQELSKSKALKLASCSPSIRRNHRTEEAHLEPACLVATAVQRGDAQVVGNGRCYFGLIDELARGSFSPLEITCNNGVPLEVLILEPLGRLKIPIPRKGRGTTQAYISRGFYEISEIHRKTEATVHLEQPWDADLSKLQVLLSSRRSSYRPYQTNGQLGQLVVDSDVPKNVKISSESRFGNSYLEDLALLTRVLRGGQNLLLGGGTIQRRCEEMV